MRTCVPLWVGVGFLVLCGTGVFAKAGGILGFVTIRWGSVSWMRCVLQARRGMGFTTVFCPTLSFLRLCGFVAGWGFLWGVCLFFPLVFHGRCGVGLVNSVGLRGRLLGWG